MNKLPASHGIVAILKKNNRYLLLQDTRELMKDLWGPPHGRCEENDECEENTVIREVFEETKLRVAPLKKIWTTKADVKVKTISFWKTTIIEGEIYLDARESSDYGWFTLEEALELPLYPATKRFFELLKLKKIEC